MNNSRNTLPVTLRDMLTLLGLFIALKVFLASKVQLLPEEAYYWNYSIHLAPGYLDHPPLSAWFIALGNWILGTNELGVRCITILLGLMTTSFVFILTRRLYGELAAIISIAFSSFLPFFCGNSFYASPDAPLAVAWSGILLLITRITSQKNEDARFTDWILLGVSFGIGLLAKYTISLLALSISVCFLLRKDLRKWFLRPEPYMAGIIALILFSPVIYWNATHEWASLVFQSTRRLEEPSRFSLHQYLLYLLVLATPVGVWEACRLARTRDPGRPEELLLKLSFFIPTAVFCVFTLSHPPRFNWPGMMLIGLIPLFSKSVAEVVAHTPATPSKLVAAWKSALVISCVAFLGFWSYLGIGIPFAPYRAKMSKLIGWEDLATHVSSVAEGLAPTTPKSPIVVGMDKHYTPAELNFYLHKRHSVLQRAAPSVIGRSIFGLESLMFQYWSAGAVLDKDDTMILVARSLSDLEAPAVVQSFSEMSPVSEYLSTTNGKKSGRYFYRIGRGFRGITGEP